MRIGRRTRRTAELPGVGVAAVERVHVLHLGLDVLELVAGFERVPAENEGVVEFRVEDLRVLPLGVGGLAAKIGVAVDQLRRQAAGDPRVGRQPGDAVAGERGLRAERRRILAAHGARPAEPAFQQRRARLHPGEAGHALLVGDVGLPVAGATGGQRQRRLVDDVDLAMTVASEHRQGRRDLDIDLAGVLVGGVGLILQRREVVRGAGGGRVGQPGQHLARKGRHRKRRAGWVDRAGLRVAYLDPQDALALGGGRNGREDDVLPRLPEALEVGEEEGAVLDDRSAEGEPVLVTLERRFLARHGFEEPGRVQLGVAVELPGRPAEPVGAALVGGVDGCAGAAPVLGAHVVGDDLELGHGVGRGLHHLVREALVRGAVGVVVDAVEQEVVEGRAQAVDVERPLARGRAAGVQRRQADAGAEQHQARVLAAVERQLDDLLGGHHLAALARVGLEARGRRGHLDRSRSTGPAPATGRPFAGLRPAPGSREPGPPRSLGVPP